MIQIRSKILGFLSWPVARPSPKFRHQLSTEKKQLVAEPQWFDAALAHTMIYCTATSEYPAWMIS